MAGGISWFWNERFWLPPNVTWADLKTTEDKFYPQIDDFYVAVPLALVLLLVRIIFERIIATPIAHLVGVKASNRYRAEPNTILEKVFTSVSKNPDQKRLDGLAKQLDWSVRSVERWFRRRRNQDRPTLLVKFRETCWRALFYVVAFSYGISTFPTEAWFWDVKLCWRHFPFHSVSVACYTYYLMEMSFYLSLIFSLFSDVRRKDFIPQLIHHVTAITLMSFSWICNFVRVGCIILVTHDISDIFLEVGKLCKYASSDSAANALFVAFVVTFFLSRIIYLPLWLIYSSMFESVPIMGLFPAYYLFNGLLVVLLSLNAYWFCLILNMVYKAICLGQLTKDERSDVEESLSDNEVAEEENGFSNHNDIKYSNNHVYASARTVANHH